VNDRLYDLADLVELLRGSGLHGFVPFGITVGDSGLLFDVYPDASRRLLAKKTDFADLLRTDAAREAFSRLSLEERYRMVDLAYQPNGYTLFGFGRGAAERLGPEHRILRNAVIL
jgi:hypothetical protein